MKYLLLVILIITITGNAMSGPQYRKKLEKKWKPVVFDTKEPTYTEPVNKTVQWKGIKVGGVYGKQPNFSSLLKNFLKN
jgi:hypothetical protein